MGNSGVTGARGLRGLASSLWGGLKRTHQQAELASSSTDSIASSPKRKRLKSTTEYIYEVLFVKGENSDVTIVALGREWHLHKVYLCQSGYFASMFNGTWREATMDRVNLDIVDSFIDEKGLNVVFGTLYRDDVLIEVSNVISVLATATLFNMEELVEQAVDVMKDCISLKTVCSYHDAASRYGLSKVTAACVTFLERNLMSSMTPTLLADISVELMQKVIESPDLYVIQVEMDIYALLRKWLFLKLSPGWSGDVNELTKAAETYFKPDARTWSGSFLETEVGSEYIGVFSGLRVRHVVVDLLAVRLLEAESIIPRGWLLSAYRDQWLRMLHVENGSDSGPQTFDAVEFSKSALRCGRILPVEIRYYWRWTGFNFGLDILVTYSNRQLSIKRNSGTNVGSLSTKPSRHLIYRLTVSSFDDKGASVFVQTTGNKCLSLLKDQETVILTVNDKATFPLQIACSLLVCSGTHDPGSSSPVPAPSPQPSVNAVSPSSASSAR